MRRPWQIDHDTAWTLLSIRWTLLLLLFAIVRVVGAVPSTALSSSWAASPSWYQHFSGETGDEFDLASTALFFAPSPAANTGGSAHPNDQYRLVATSAISSWKVNSYGSGDSGYAKLSLADEDLQPYALPAGEFFAYAGGYFDILWIGSNGYVGLTSSAALPCNSTCATPDTLENFFTILANYEDLDPSRGKSNVTVWVENQSPSGVAVVVQFAGVLPFCFCASCDCDSTPISFQVELGLEDSHVGLYYDNYQRSAKELTVGLMWGQSALSVDLSSYTATSPFPEGSVLTFGARSSSSIELSWPAVSGYDRYQVLVNQDGKFVQKSVSTGSSATATGLSPATTYTLYVNVAGPKYDGTFVLSTNQLSGTCSTIIGSVSDLENSAVSENSLSFTWSSAGPSVNYYRVTLDPGDLVQTIAVPEMTYSDLISGLSYTFSVVPLDDETTYDPAAISTKTTSPVANARLRSGTVSASSLQVEWLPVMGASGYACELFSSDTKISSQDVSGNDVSFTDLEEASLYTVKVFAKNSLGVASSSLSSLSELTLCSPVASLGVSDVGSSYISYSWEASTSASAYTLLLEMDDVEVARVTGVMGSTYTFDGLMSSVGYSLTMFAANSQGAYETVGSSVATTTLPKQPSYVYLTEVKGDSCCVSWTSVSGADSYQVHLTPGDQSATESDTTTSFSGLTPGQEYCVEVCTEGQSTACTNISFSANDTTVNNLHVEAAVDTLAFSWEPAADPVSNCLELLKEGEMMPTTVPSFADTSYNFTALDPGATFTFRIYSSVNDGITVTVHTLPSAVAEVTLSNRTSTSLQFSWPPSSGATEYHLELSDSTYVSAYPPVICFDTSYSFYGLDPNAEYHLTVYAAVFPEGHEPTGTSANATTFPQEVSDMTSKSHSDCIKFCWTESTGAANYRAVLSSSNNTTEQEVTSATVEFLGLYSSTEYSLEVFAGYGSEFDTIGTTYSTWTLPPPVTSVTVEGSTSSSIAIRWSASPSADSYRVSASPGSFNAIVVGTSYVLEGLSAQTDYTLCVQSGDSAVGYDSDCANADGHTLVSAVKNLTCDPSLSSFAVSWISSASDFIVTITQNGIVVENATAASTPFPYEEASAGAVYDVAVFAGDGHGYEGVGSSVTCGMAPQPLPSITVFQLTESTVGVEWDMPEDANVFSCEVFDAEENLVGHKTVTSNLCEFSGLSADASYTICVFAGLQLGSVTNAAYEATGVRQSTGTLPLPPSSLQLTESTSTSFNASWTAPSGATAYNAFLKLEDTAIAKTVDGAGVFFDGLPSASYFTLEVRSVGAAGTSAGISTLSAFTYPPYVANLRNTSVASNGFAIAFSAAPGATSYKVTLSVSSSGAVISSATQASLSGIFSSLSAYTLYKVQVQSGLNGRFDPSAAILLQWTLSAAISVYNVACKTSTSIEVTFEPTPGLEYVVAKLYQGSSLVDEWTESYSTRRTTYSLSVSQLTRATAYTLQLFTGCNVGVEQTGLSIAFSTFQPPPTILNGVGNSSDNSVTLQWPPVTGISSYKVVRFSYPDHAAIDDETVSGTQTRYSGLTPGAIYQFGVAVCVSTGSPKCSSEYAYALLSTETTSCQAVDDTANGATFPLGSSGNNATGTCGIGWVGTPVRLCDSNGNWGNYYSSCVQLPAQFGSQPTATSSCYSVTVSWTAPARATMYKILIQYSSSSSPVVANNGTAKGITGMSMVVNGLSPGCSYVLQLCPGNAAGYVACIPFTVQTHLPVPSNLHTTYVTTTSLGFAWGPSDEANGYDVTFQQNSPLVTNGLSFNASDLQPGTKYTLTVDPIRGSYVEPNGASITVSTDAIAGHASNGAIAGGVVGGIVILIVIGALLWLLWWRRKRSNRATKVDSQSSTPNVSMQTLKQGTPSDSSSVSPFNTSLTDLSYVAPISQQKQNPNAGNSLIIPSPGTSSYGMSSANNSIVSVAGAGNSIVSVAGANNSIVSVTNMSPSSTYHIPPKPSAASPTSPLRSIETSSDATMINTVMEVSVPGFLKLDYENHMRNLGPLGSGGTATVFRGELLDTELITKYKLKDVALKQVMEWPNLTPEENAERFLQEVAVIWNVTFHPNIMTLIGFTETPRYIVSKMYETDLQHVVDDATQRISSPIGLHYIKGICKGMKTMNQLGIVHRDLKPGNILLEPSRDRHGNKIYNAVICDFGLARVFRDVTLENQNLVPLTGFSPKYAAPEVFLRSRQKTLAQTKLLEIKGDVYSLGLIIWALIARKSPWEGLDRKEVEDRVTAGYRPDFVQNMDLQADVKYNFLVTMMHTCWQQDPDQRPSFDAILEKCASMGF